MREFGPVHVGTSSADFSVMELASSEGWLISCHHPDIITFVPIDVVPGGEENELIAGILGRCLREDDAENLDVIFAGIKMAAEQV